MKKITAVLLTALMLLTLIPCTHARSLSSETRSRSTISRCGPTAPSGVCMRTGA